MENKQVIHSILVPTDFSSCADLAVDAGLRLAERFNASLHLLHVLSNEQQAETDLIESAQGQLQAYGKETSLPISRVVTTGNLQQEVATYARDYGISLVLVGSHGASGKSEYFIGSNAQRVVRSVHCPVLILKKPLEHVAFDKVLFASRFHTDELPAFRFFLDVVRPFLPEIHLVEVHTGSLFDPPAIVSEAAMQDFKNETGALVSHIHLAHNFSADRGVRELAADLGADLIVISNHLRHPLKRMLVGSTVEALVNHSDLPVLSIDFLE